MVVVSFPGCAWKNLFIFTEQGKTHEGGMEATQLISDSILESDEDISEDENKNERGQPLAKLCILKNQHVSVTEMPLYLGDNILGRDPSTCTLLLPAPSVSKQHATICISVCRRKGHHNEVDMEALVWDHGSMNGTRKGRFKLTSNVRYALSDGDSLVVADIPCRYVSSAVDTVSSQGDTRTPVSRNARVKARLEDASGEKGDDKSAGSKKCVNGGTEATVSLTKTPVRTSCLSFEQTPIQPEGTLVPESDSDSDGERQGGGDRRHKPLVSDCDSHKSSPTCSTFLSPTNKIVPESEDESPITPSSWTKNRPYRHVSFSKEETEGDVGRQLLEEKKAHAILDDSKEEEGMEEERAAPEGTKSEKSGQHVPMKLESNVILTGEDELPVSTPAVSTDAIPTFHMDSDTDMEGEEEEVASVGPVTLNTTKVGEAPNTAQFHMDSDTDVDEDESALAAITVPSSDNSKPHVNSVVQPEGVTADSDTDVEDAAAVSDVTTKAQSMSFQSAHTADSAPLSQQKDFHLDSDTDVDEEEKRECGTNNSSSKVDETPTRSDINSTEPESGPVAPDSLHLNSDTDDDEVIPAPVLSGLPVMSAATKSGTTADGGADFQSDSDTDVDGDSPLVIPVAIGNLSFSADTMSKALESDSDADTDVDESSMHPAGDKVNPHELRVGDDTNVEDKGAGKEGGDGQIPDLCREETPRFLIPLQNCSTPVESAPLEEKVENMDTQAFPCPSSVPFRRAAAVIGGPVASSGSEEDEDFVVAETQSFVLQTRDCQSKPPEDHAMDSTQAFGIETSGDEKSSRGESFQLGLSDSSHLQCEPQTLTTESIQQSVYKERSVNLEDTQAYADFSTSDRTSGEKDVNLEATQAYVENEQSARYSGMSEKDDLMDLALEATQAYTSERYRDTETDKDDDERKNTAATAKTQPLGFPISCTLAMAETQPMFSLEEEGNMETDVSVSPAQHRKPRTQNETEEREEHKSCGEILSMAETQPMCTYDDEESNNEDSLLGPPKRKARPLQLEEEQTQPLINCELSIEETQPMHVDETTSENKDSEDEDDLIPGLRKRKAKQLHLEEDVTQTLTNSEVSAAEHQSVNTAEGGESDEEESILISHVRRTKPLQLEQEETQPLSPEVCTAATQPMAVCEGPESDDENSVPLLPVRKRKAKVLQIDEEQTQPLIVETQPIVTGDESDDSIPASCKRKLEEEETPPLTVSEVPQTDFRPESLRGRQSEAETSGVNVRNKRETRTRLREGEEQAECAGSSKRQTRGKNKVLPTTRGRRGKSRPCEDESEEEEEVEPARKVRGKGKKSTQQQKDDKEAVETERTEPGESGNLSTKRQEGGLGEEKHTADLRCQQREEKEESDEREREQGETKGQYERERKEKEDQERLQVEAAERIRQEQEAAERERKEREEKERSERILKEKEEQMERERKEREEKERLEREKAEREKKEELEREENERIEKERKELEEKQRLEREKRELEERLENERTEQEQREANEREERERLEREKEIKEKQMKEQEENVEDVNTSKVPTRGRRAARRTVAAPCITEPEQDPTVSTNDDVPARRTRSRSNSSNSVSSERSASSGINTQEGRGRGGGRGAKRTSEAPQVNTSRGSNRRRTVAAETEEQSSNDIFQGGLSRSNSSSPLTLETSSCSVNSQNRGRGRGSRQRGRSMKLGPEQDAIPPINTQNLTPRPAARGRRSGKSLAPSAVVPLQGDFQQPSTTRGRHRANTSGPEYIAADEEDQLNQEGGDASVEAPLLKRNARGRGQKAVKSEAVEAPVVPAVSDGVEAKDKRKGRKREMEANAEEGTSGGSKISKEEEKTQTDETQDENPVQAKRRGRASCAQIVMNLKESPPEAEVREESEKTQKKGRGRAPAVRKNKKEEQEESETSVSSLKHDAHVEPSEPQTPTSKASRKRQSPLDSSPAAKTPRSSTASPAASGRLRAAGQAYKVLYTGVVDEAGERLLPRLGGSIAQDVTNMNCLVTDKVRRTVKFLCAVAKGIPIVTTSWLEKSGKAGSFLSPNAFIVKDPEQEKKFSFCLEESLRIASSQPLLQGYEIHVTKSVKPEPAQMKDIISCSGATFLPKMPSSHKPQTVVISCEEDWSLCRPAVSAGLPVVTAEFILSGILQQKVDIHTHTLSPPVACVQPAAGRGRSRKKT